MKYFKDTNNKPFVFEDNVTPEIIKRVENVHKTTLTEITQAEFEILTMPTIDQLKQQKKNQLIQNYESELNSNITYMNTEFQADEKSQNLISKTLIASGGSLPDDFYWLDVYNNKVPMTYTDLQGLANAILLRRQQLFDKLQTLKAQVRNATSITELEAIVW